MSDRTPQSRYEAAVALAIRFGAWLESPQARALPEAAWEERFQRYQDTLDEVRRLGEDLRPVGLRDHMAPSLPCGDRLVDEVLEVFK